jgi:putative ABC transport system permease protein
MFLLRIYKLIIRLLLVPVKKINVPSLYLSIVNVLRDHLKKNTAMLFVVITVALGIYNINIAKNINTSYENTVKYMSGADLVLKGAWEKYLSSTYFAASESDDSRFYQYIEPSYSDYSKVEGIESYTKVLNTPNGQVTLSKGGTNLFTSLLAIVPHEFGKIAWFDSDLLNYHWYHYLNTMTEKKDYVLISRGLSESSSIRKGDTIYYKIDRGLSVRGVVAEIIDYWPGFENLQSKNLIISNFNYMFSNLPKYPYEVWIKKQAGVSDKVIYDSMQKLNIGITAFKSMSYNMYNAKNEIFLKGTNAILTLSFLSIAAITIIGFIIYWVISLKSRVLQFGIYRSLGLSSNGVSKLLILEQVLTLGSSILLGTLLGVLTGQLFIPIIKGLWYYNKYAIPVKHINYINEYLQLGAIIAVIFIFSLFVLRKYISSLKIHQAVKLGED